jgi:UDP-glucose 4-epimerase
MKIAVLGANGFVGSSILGYLSSSDDVIPVTRSTVDLLDRSRVLSYLREHQFDAIVNCAAVMRNNDLIDDTRNNLGIFMNFYDLDGYFGKFINLGSGAEYDRTTNIDRIDENMIPFRMPSDSYGFGQNIKSRLCLGKDGFHTIRIFNCFGQGEAQTRLFPRLLSHRGVEPFEIRDDRYFDYFSIADLCRVVASFIRNDHPEKDINAVYRDKILISEAARRFCAINGIYLDIRVSSTSDNNYCGSGDRLASLPIKLDGLDEGFRTYATTKFERKS